MRLSFWLLDINTEKEDSRPEVQIWGITEDGRRVLLLDRSFIGSFFVVPKNLSPDEVAKKISAVKGVEKTEIVRRKLLGKEIDAIRVYVRDPDEIDEVAKKISKMEFVNGCYGHDIRYSMQYMFEKGISPSSWFEVEVEEEVKSNVRVDGVFRIVGDFKRVERSNLPDLRIMAFHCVLIGGKGSPDPERDPITAISVLGDDVKTFIGDEKDVLSSFVGYISSFDPDIIFGYGTNKRDWDYLVKRAKINGIHLDVGRVKSEPHTSVYGHVSITGRANMDLMDFAEDLYEVKLKTLENVAEYLGLGRPDDIEEHELREMREKGDLGSIAEFSRRRVNLIRRIGDKFIEYAVQLSQIVGLPLDHVASAAVGFRVEWFIIREALERGELIPQRKEVSAETYVGGMVLTPKPGIHSNVAVLDFASMYPNIMVLNNISPDTYIPPDEKVPPEECNIAPEVGYCFRKEPPGLYKEILRKLLSARKEIKEALARAKEGSAEYKLLAAREKAIKVIANATYGYCGWVGARWYMKPVAEATAAWGRYTIRRAMEIAKKMKLEIIYGDTDSIFVKYDAEKVNKLLEEIKRELSLDIKLERVFKRIIFTEAKKRYAGLLEDGTIDVVGLEFVRGDWPKIARDAQKKVIEIILTEENVERGIKKAKEYVLDLVSMMKAGKIPLKHYIIWKEITKSAEDYKARAPHVEVARIMREKGWRIQPGDKVGYVVVKGSGKLYQRSLPYFMARIEDIDVEYYIENQVIPAVMRVLSPLGVKELGISTGGLADFF
jgi:DNA polymerase I